MSYFGNDFSEIDSQEMNSTDTECIEYCTSECLNNTDVYTCFDNCTLKRCGNTENQSNENLVILSGHGKITFVLLLGFGLFINFYVGDDIRNYYNYWRL